MCSMCENVQAISLLCHGSNDSTTSLNWWHKLFVVFFRLFDFVFLGCFSCCSRTRQKTFRLTIFHWLKRLVIFIRTLSLTLIVTHFVRLTLFSFIGLWRKNVDHFSQCDFFSSLFRRHLFVPFGRFTFISRSKTENAECVRMPWRQKMRQRKYTKIKCWINRLKLYYPQCSVFMCFVVRCAHHTSSQRTTIGTKKQNIHYPFPINVPCTIFIVRCAASLQ